MRPEGFPRSLRLRKRREFLRIQRYGTKLHLEGFLVFIEQVSTSGELCRERSSHTAPQPRLATLRIGITVTKKIGNAVVRNKIRRWVREAFRRTRCEFPSGLELVFVAKKQVQRLDYAAVCSDMERASRALQRRFGPSLHEGVS